ncbi:MAG: peptidase domain-containing ABC transporter [Mesorhizobium sp.]
MQAFPDNDTPRPPELRDVSASSTAVRDTIRQSAKRGSGDDGPKETIPARIKAVQAAARFHGIELDTRDCREQTPNAAGLAEWARRGGMWARAVRVNWSHLIKLQAPGPVVLLLNDGGAVLLVGSDADRNVVFLKSANDPEGAEARAIDELRLVNVWNGEVVLLRAARSLQVADAPFTLGWLATLVRIEAKPLRDIAIASIALSVLTVLPPLIVMTVVNKVLQFSSTSTLVLLSAIIATAFLYETLLSHARRLIVNVVGARIDTKLNLHVFSRLLRLPLDYFEKHPAGETMYHLAQVYRIREFLTGKLLSTFLDLITLCVLLPVMFIVNSTLAWIVVTCSVLIVLIIVAFLPPLRKSYQRVVEAETMKSAAMSETVVGIKTVKALGLEPQREALWDERVANAGNARLAFGQLASWPQTLVTPLERTMVLGTMLFGAYLALNDTTGYMVGGLFAFMMLAQRVAQPLVNLARLVEDYEEVGAAVSEAASVLNQPLESAANSAGVRPDLFGDVSFNNLSFSYSGAKTPALDGVSFNIPAGTMFGIVGRSGSGKSTIARLLQGINRDYTGFLKVDGIDLKEINLRHLRQGMGIVLQDNFLFRGSIKDNIIAGRAGLTLADAMRAAQLAGAEEFVERMPHGFDTYVEEGSPNLSGGQRQRLAIARALIHNPSLLILDEATSALDPESEAIVSANLQRIAAGRTMIIVSHRLASLTDCDQILVLDQGKVVDVASHTVLLERCALYRQLWFQQNRPTETRGPRPIAIAPRLT